MITGGIVMIAGGAAIVLTAGMATPIVATVAVTGTCTMAYGASNMVEGAQDVYYASIGDLDSAAINPIRDTVFAGNQKLYDAWGSLNMTVASLCVPAGQAVNGMAGASTRMMTQTAIKVAGKELVKDQIFDFASGEITAYMADRFALNQTQSTLLELAVSTTMDKGSDLLGDKISGSKGDPFTDRMSFEDAKRYNAHWKDVEAGTHNNPPGLSSEDIAAWDFADRKVNDHITINKVDVNEVINLRMAENAKQNAFLNERVKVESGTTSVKKVFTDKPFDENGKLKTNIKYQTGEFNYNYETDANGRISNWNTDNLQLTEREGRLDYNADTPGKEAGDHAGHLAGDRFGGSPELDNIVSQSQNVNLSQYKKIENQWAKAISEGKEVTVNVDVKYDGDGLRPIEFNVEYTIDGDFFSQSILN